MDTSQENNNQRRSFRCRIRGPARQAELRIGERHVPVRLFDESAGGFAVISKEPPGVDCGAVIQLHLDSGAYEVRVAYVGPAEEVISSGEAPPLRIGLQRLRDLAVFRKDGRPNESWIRTFLCRMIPGRPAGYGLAVLLVLLAIGIPLALFVPIPRVEPSTTHVLANVGNRLWSWADGSNANRRSRPAAPLLKLPDWSWPELDLGRSAGPSDILGLSSLARLPDGSGLLAAEMIRELELTDAQQRQIRQIVDGIADAVKSLDTKFVSRNRQDLSRLEECLIQDGRQQAIEVLTPEQRRHFEVLLDDPR